MKYTWQQILLLYCICLLAVTKTQGQTLNDYLVIAAENNPVLKARFYEYQAALQKIPQAGALPDPQITFGLFIMPVEEMMGRKVIEITLMQMFPWFGTPGAARNEATLMAKMRYEAFTEARNTLFYEVKATWYAMFLLEQEIAITEDNLQILRTLEQIALSRFRSGASVENISPGTKPNTSGIQTGTTNPGAGSGMNMQGSGSTTSPSVTRDMNQMSSPAGMGIGSGMVDVLRIQIEANELENVLELLKDNRIPLRALFNKLLNRPVGEPVAVPDSIAIASLPVSLAEIPDSILLNNPMLKMLEKEEEALLAQGAMNRKMGFPMIGIGLQYDLNKKVPDSESMMNGKDMLMPMITFSLPLWRKKYKASVLETDYLREAVTYQIQDVANQLMVDYQEALKELKDAERRLVLYRQQATLATQVNNILTVEYATAGKSIDEVLNVQQQLLNYRLRSLNALVDGNIAAAMLDRLMGR
jgi:outer membrane protein TolC